MHIAETNPAERSPISCFRFGLRKKQKELGMGAICFERHGSPGVLNLKTVPKPILKDDEVLIKVEATTVNRKDIWRREGRFPHNGRSPCLGLECSGEIVKIGQRVSEWKRGDKVCALLESEGYAEFVAVREKHVIPAPDHLSLEESACLPYAGCVIWFSFCMMNKVGKGQTMLIHGAAGGVGSLAIQVAKYYGCKVFITAGTEKKLSFCRELGADVCINHKKEDFSKRVNAETNGNGVDYIFDLVDHSSIQTNLSALAMNGRLLLVEFQAEAKVELDLGLIGKKQILVIGVDIENTTFVDKTIMMNALKTHIWPAIARSEIKPMIYKRFKFSEAAEAHRLMEKNDHLGKILLIP